MADDDVEGGAGGDDAELGAAVDDAVADEVKRMRARFVAQILGVDRAEGVGRGEEHWNESLRRDTHRDVGVEPPDDAEQ
ncbi:MAG TPA: hypothetical protein VGH76_24035 [Actinomycetospora sp.]|jgi:hypothetical protein|uniref:hypothetical protein n=1 Tax=Actinomycetospora sp. TaxID=1872135 RepID=UPI002F3E312E